MRPKELECQFSFFAHLHCYADGRWAPILHLTVIMEFFLPNPGSALVSAFPKVGAKFFRLSLGLQAEIIYVICAHEACSDPRCRKNGPSAQKNCSNFVSLNTGYRTGLIRWMSLFTVECSQRVRVLSNSFLYLLLANNTVHGLFAIGC